MSEEITTTEVQVMDNSALQLITRAEIDSQIATAKAFPRSLKQSMDRALSMATVNEEVAASCTYAVPRSGKTIEGASVRLAEIVCSTFGNLRAGARVIANDGKTVTAQGICHDLESNYSVTVEVKKKITDRNGKPFSDDMQVVTGNAACAIAYRNAVYKVIPAAIIDDIWEKTKEVARGKAETLVKRRDKAVEYFRSQGVKDEQICTVLQIKKIEDIDLDKLQTLRGILTSVKNGEATLKDLFEPESNQPDPAELKKQTIIELIKTASTEAEVNKQMKHLPNDKDVQMAALERKTELEKNA